MGPASGVAAGGARKFQLLTLRPGHGKISHGRAARRRSRRRASLRGHGAEPRGQRTPWWDKNIIVFEKSGFISRAALNFHFPSKIIADSTDYCAIEKPIGIETDTLFVKKNSTLSPIYFLDGELGGIILCAKNKQFYNNLRNAYGSAKVAFHFTIFAQSNGDLSEEITCNLPIAQHRARDSMIISHTTGKKTQTIFKKIDNLNRFTLWSAEIFFLRKHQIRLHAHGVGIKILGEDIYDKIPAPILSDFKLKTKSNRKKILMPLYPAICIYLSEINFSHGNHDIKIVSPPPNKFATMLKIIQKWN
jgi:23S rRNA-/tRNA-specific pseudouridylate synthase